MALTWYNFTPYTIKYLLIPSQGKHLFVAGVKRMSSQAIETAIKMKRAGRENRRLRALASAWKIKEVEHYSTLVRYLHEEDYTNFCDYFEDQAGDLQGDVNNVDGLVAYNRELYNEQLASLGEMDVQLDHLEEVMSSRIGLAREASCDSDEHTESEDDGDKGI